MNNGWSITLASLLILICALVAALFTLAVFYYVSGYGFGFMFVIASLSETSDGSAVELVLRILGNLLYLAIPALLVVLGISEKKKNIGLFIGVSVLLIARVLLPAVVFSSVLLPGDVVFAVVTAVAFIPLYAANKRTGTIALCVAAILFVIALASMFLGWYPFGVAGGTSRCFFISTVLYYDAIWFGLALAVVRADVAVQAKPAQAKTPRKDLMQGVREIHAPKPVPAAQNKDLGQGVREMRAPKLAPTVQNNSSAGVCTVNLDSVTVLRSASAASRVQSAPRVEQAERSADAEKLQQLKHLFDQGVITEEEFDGQKKKFLGL